jgi:hypothetical protein
LAFLDGGDAPSGLAEMEKEVHSGARTIGLADAIARDHSEIGARRLIWLRHSLLPISQNAESDSAQRIPLE